MTSRTFKTTMRGEGTTPRETAPNTLYRAKLGRCNDCKRLESFNS